MISYQDASTLFSTLANPHLAPSTYGIADCESSDMLLLIPTLLPSGPILDKFYSLCYKGIDLTKKDVKQLWTRRGIRVPGMSLL